MFCWFLPMQQCGSALSTHISPPPWASLPSYPSRLSRSTRLNSLSYKTTFHQSSILHMAMHVSMLLSQFLPPSPSLTVFSSLFSSSVFLFLPLTEVHQWYFSRFHTYVLIYNICFSLPDLAYSEWKALGLSTSIQLTQICSFLLAEWYFIVYMCPNIFIHSSVEWHLGCFHVLSIVNSAAVNTRVHMTFWIMVFSGHMLGHLVVLLLGF